MDPKIVIQMTLIVIMIVLINKKNYVYFLSITKKNETNSVLLFSTIAKILIV